MVKLNLGCGLRLKRDFINVDVVDLTQYGEIPEEYEFMVWDLNKRPWPWEDESVDAVVMRDSLEHLEPAFFEIMNELWRILKPGKRAGIQVPDYRYATAFRDPTHRMFFIDGSFDYLDPHTEIGKDYIHYTPYKWRIEKEISPPGEGLLRVILRKDGLLQAKPDLRYEE